MQDLETNKVDERYDRNIGVWDHEFQKKLESITIGVAGLGGSGEALVSILARNGFGTFKFADPDYFEASNIQRQLYATESTLNQMKVDVSAQGVKEINPSLQVEVYPEGVTRENMDDFLDGCDFLHEVMDYSVPEIKVGLNRKAHEKGIITTSSAIIGTGVATLAFHPDKMSFEEYFGIGSGEKQSIDLIAGSYPDYLDKEIFLKRIKEGQVPTTADGAFLTGVMAAGIYKRILMGKDVSYAPDMLRWDVVDDVMYKQSIIRGKRP